jgi:hypothetical protein
VLNLKAATGAPRETKTKNAASKLKNSTRKIVNKRGERTLRKNQMSQRVKWVARNPKTEAKEKA